MKSARHARILEIIENRVVETQDELAEHLRASGFTVTQATVSRDIKELRLIKTLSGDGIYAYAVAERVEARMQERYLKMFEQSVLSISPAGNIIVIKTLTGSANVAAEAIDSLHWPGLVGTIAGDNTIFVAVSDEHLVSEFIDKLRSISSR